MLLLVLLPGSVALQVWAWRSLHRRVMAGAITKAGAVVRYGGWALLPFSLLLGIYLGAVGVEEVSGAAIVHESLGRAALPVAALLLGISGLGWLSFVIVSALVWRMPPAKPQASR